MDTSGGSFTIEQFRQQLGLQKIREHRNRFGSRYRDYLSFLGINPSDARLQRPEYLGGGKATISFSEVLSTSDTVTDVQTGSELGDYAGHGIATIRTPTFKRFFEEHGTVISLMVARPRALYPQAIDRMFWRDSPWDYWQKEYEVEGDQQVNTAEMYSQSLTPTAVFGYQERFQEYRRKFNEVCAEFRESNLDDWHFGRFFSADPVLDSAFLECNPPKRPASDNTQHLLRVMAYNQISMRRLVKKRARYWG